MVTAEQSTQKRYPGCVPHVVIRVFCGRFARGGASSPKTVLTNGAPHVKVYPIVCNTFCDLQLSSTHAWLANGNVCLVCVHSFFADIRWVT